MTTISYKRTGGAMGQDLSVDFNLNEMPGDAAQRLHNLINESKFFATPVQQEVLSKPDEFEYTVTIDAGQSVHTIRATDTSMPESLRPLIEALTQLAKAAEQ
jgi:hypothetical protein